MTSYREIGSFTWRNDAPEFESVNVFNMIDKDDIVALCISYDLLLDSFAINAALMSEERGAASRSTRTRTSKTAHRASPVSSHYLISHVHRTLQYLTLLAPPVNFVFRLLFLNPVFPE